METHFVLKYAAPVRPVWQGGSISSLLVAFVQPFSNKRNLLTHEWLIDMVYIILPNNYSCVARGFYVCKHSKLNNRGGGGGEWAPDSPPQDPPRGGFVLRQFAWG